MKTRSFRRRVGVLLLCLLAAAALILPASANSAQTWFQGQDSTGAFMPEGSESPIVVEGERLIFDLPHFPVLHGSAEDNAAYEASVTAEYTFYNPSDYTVTSRLLFPFGQKPYYMDGAFDPETGEHVPFDDTAAYAITLDGEAVERCVWFPQMHQYQTHFRKSYAGTWVDSSPENEISLYVLGAPLDEPIAWALYEDGGLDPFEKIEGSVTLLRTETQTLRELALADWYAESGVSEVDWYNAVIASLDGNTDAGGLISRTEYYAPGNDISSRLMRWYEYEITFAPGQRRINTVTAPIYPAVDMDWEPDVYEYTYLLSPAATWVDFGRIEIFINTPYYIVNDENNAFEKTEQGYQRMLPGLPEGELTFSLSTVEDPKRESHNGWMALLWIFLAGCAIVITYGAVILLALFLWNVFRFSVAALIIFLMRRREKKKTEEE